MVVSKRCVMCENTVTLELTTKEYIAWKEGKAIKEAMPDLAKDDRDFLVSGICGVCSKKNWVDEEENS